ncbi:pleckstrin (PH) domain-containing protein [Tieghemostelium lacteum]|uniref:Pleckstrin (PH) domain-containing protein n=1 Tax=Tieghemostelium lacteum TaxID=361077 RepID=A0A152A3X6_TIELA|nr:pleckstrin (PH) domain-containing protein [Tieghemostelium lacteum]|eukprot:KYR00777.1 pleckstrin (PH) domain-containing protein [Tieghemostelium lacteum]
MDQYESKSNKLLLSIGQLSESRSKKVLIGFCHDLINVEKKTITDNNITSSPTQKALQGDLNGNCNQDSVTASPHLIDLCFSQINKTLSIAQPSILWKIVEYSISELDYLERILDLYKENSKENGKLLSSASSRLEEISSLLLYLQTLPKMNTPEYIELIGGINAHIKKITLRIKGELEQNRYSNSKKYGWIEKRCGNSQSFRTWKKMWFILGDNLELYYYIKEKTQRKNHSRQLTNGDQNLDINSSSSSGNGGTNNDHSNHISTSQPIQTNNNGNGSFIDNSNCNNNSNNSSNNINTSTVIYLEGELGKKKEGKGWKIRWMKLLDQSLVYYKSQKDKDPLGIIDLNCCQDCEIYKDDSNKFVVIHSVNKYYFQTDKREDLQKWVQMVKHKIESLKSKTNKPVQVDLSTFYLKGIIDLSKAVSIQECFKFHSQAHCLSISTLEKNYYLSFDSNRDKMDWLQLLSAEPALRGKVKTSTSGPGSLSSQSSRKWEIGSISRATQLLSAQADEMDDIGSQILPRKITMSQSKLAINKMFSNQNMITGSSPNKSNSTTTSPSGKLQQQQQLQNNQSTSSNSSAQGSAQGDDSDQDQDLVSMLIPETLKNEIMRKSAYNLLKTFKLEIFLSNSIHSLNNNNNNNNNSSGSSGSITPTQDVYTFLFSDSVLVDQVKAYAFKKIPVLKDLNLMEYRLGIDEDNILEIEFLKFIYSHTMVELALKTCGIVKIGIFHHSKDRRVKEKLYPEKYQNSLSSGVNSNDPVNSTSVITPLLVSSNNAMATNTVDISSPKTLQMSVGDLSSSSSSIVSTTSTISSMSTMNSTTTLTGTTSTSSTVSSLNNTPNLLKGSVGSINMSPSLIATNSPLVSTGLLISKCPGWNIELVNQEFTLKGYQPKFNKQEHGFYRKYIFESSQGVVYSFLGTDPKMGPLAFSLVKDLSDNYRGVLHSKYGAKTISVESKCIQIGNLTSLSKKLKTKKIVGHLLHEMDHTIDSKVLSLASNQDELQKELLSLEERQTTSGFKFGLVYCKQGQTTDDELFSNQNGSQEWEIFLDLLGEKIELLNWPHYSAGLDVRSNSTGTHSLYTDFNGNEIMFHVSTLLPYSNADPQQIERKRQVGNDICVVIFNDGTQSYSPNTIASHFNHVVILVHFNKQTNGYQVSCSTKDGVVPFEPNIPHCDIKKSEIKDFLLTKLINGELASLQAPVFSQKILRTRESLLNYYIEQFL